MAVFLPLLLCSASLKGQVQAGSDVLMGLDGSVSTGYSGSTNNQGPSSHGITFGGTGNLNGSYYSPQFLSFNVAPFFNQSRNNSNYQSITDSSGVTANANLFGGSQFPGYFNFSKIYNSETAYSIPGLANYATNGNNQTFGVGWSANVKDLPTLTVGYQQGSSDYSLYGLQQNSFSNFHSVFGSAHYTVDGFSLSGSVHYIDTGSKFPQIVASEQVEKASSNTTTYTFGMSRAVALHGNTWANFTRNTTEYDALGVHSSETADILSGGLALKPTDKLTAQFNADYNDNLAGSILQTLNGAGATTRLAFSEAPSHSWGLSAGAQYSVLPGLFVGGTIFHRQQLFLGTSFDSTAYGASVNYGRNLLGGQFSASATVTRSSYGSNGYAALGFLSNLIYIRNFGVWSLSGSFNYSENVQTTLISYTSSGYGYSLSANRRLGSLNWTVSGNESRSLLTQLQGTRNFTQGYSTGLSGRWLGASVGYSRSSGTGLYSAGGITTLPPGVPPTLLPAVILYGGTTYTAGVGSNPIRGLTLTGNYVQSRSSTNGVGSSSNVTKQANAYLNYRFRKVYFTAGYSRLLQGFSVTGLAPVTVSTYYFGVSRWFKAF